MDYLSNLGQRANRFIVQLLPAVALSLVLASPAAAQPLAQIDASADACSLVTQQEAGKVTGWWRSM
jgi:hypothetical protein